MLLRKILPLIIVFAFINPVWSQPTPKVVHIYVALCDNKYQGIVPVPAKIGNGDDPKNNLYWGAMYGVKTYFKKSRDWKIVGAKKNQSSIILERLVFKHSTKNVYLVADAYRGKNIKEATSDFLKSTSGGNKETIVLKGKSKSRTIKIGGHSNLLAYIGHNGLMDFQLDHYPEKENNGKRETIILACVSKKYFTQPIKRAGAKPLLWTTNFMAPEAYTLKGALDGWIRNESNSQIRLRSAKAYHQYQKCGIKGAMRLFVTGW